MFKELCVIKYDECTTYEVKIYLAGPIEVAEQICRREFFKKGWCCTIDPTKYIYTGGEEEGYVIGIINYARSPEFHGVILERSLEFAELLMKETYQKSCSVVASDKTYFLSNELKEK